jgi:hypothetical protein
VFALLLVLQLGTLSAQNPANIVYDHVILGGQVLFLFSRESKPVILSEARGTRA